jgi:hypothetical protein
MRCVSPPLSLGHLARIHPAMFRWLPDFIMTSKREARKVRKASEDLDLKMSQQVQQRLAAGEDTSSFHAGMLKREEEGVKELSPFYRDCLSGALVGGASGRLGYPDRYDWLKLAFRYN